jgi:hypothetical protein
MANKRVSELTELAAANLKADDLFLVTDTAVSVLESKKIRASSIKDYVLDNGNITATVSHALLSDTASYLRYTGIPNGTASYAISASYAKSSSYSDRGFWSKYSDTASYISAAYIDGTLPSCINSDTASYVLYQYGNGTVENSKTASYCENANTSSYLWYVPGINNGTASYALKSGETDLNKTASYLRYDGIFNGSSSYSLISKYSKDGDHASVSDTAGSSVFASLAETASYAKTSSFLNYDPVNPKNGTASYAMKAYTAVLASSASHLRYTGIDNGTAFNAIFATNATTAAYSTNARSASYAGTSSLSDTASYTRTSSYSIVSETVLDTNVYRIYGPYNSNDSGGSTTTSEGYVQNFVITPPAGTTTTVIVQALCDIKVPITSTDASMTVALYLDYTEPGNTHSYGPIDVSRPVNYIDFAMSGAFTLTGHNRQSISLGHDWNPISGSWYRLSVKTTGGALLDVTRGVTFFVYTKTNTTLQKTSYPPF